MENIKIVYRDHKAKAYHNPAYGVEKAQEVQAFHQSFPEYEPTPLANFTNLAKEFGVAGLYLKDESKRFGLNAFKVLGGSYAIGKEIAKKANLKSLSFDTLMDPATREATGRMTFVTATDGNHGRGVAWTANRLDHSSVVFMPKGSSQERLENIQQFATEASITKLNYDDAVRMAASYAKSFNWTMVQDTAWEGYEEIPRHIMQGYTTMAAEAVAQLDGVVPTHVFLQAGVGSMAAAVAAYLCDYYGENRPHITIVEPNKADCLYRTAEANDGQLHFVTGHMDSIMAGLCCGEPCTLAWQVLDKCADAFVSMPDWVSANGMRLLANTPMGDPRVTSGESGAAGFGLASAVLAYKQLAPLKEAIGLKENSVILCFSTEGDTDKANYRSICWAGAYSSPLKD